MATAVPTQMITLTIDGQSVTVPQGTALIQACEQAGVMIPRFCYHDRLAIAGNCRMCLVEVEKSPKPVASCAMPAMAGAKVFTDSPLVRKAREGVMEFILANHPLDCPVCDQGGECDLQDQSVRYGGDRSRYHEITGKRAVENKDFGPLIKTEMNRCIQCTRCVRFANDVAGFEEFGTTGRGNSLEIGTYISRSVNSEISGNVLDLCPVGALLNKPYAFKARPWELKNTESVDVHDALGSSIRVDSRGVAVMRVLPRVNEEVNEEWISDKTRFACDGLTRQRLTQPMVKRNGILQTAAWSEALQAVARGLEDSRAGGDEIQIVAGALVDAETLLVAKDLANALGSENLALDAPNGACKPAHGVDIRSQYLFNQGIAAIEEADAILLIGTNSKKEAPVLNARIRKQWLTTNVEIGIVGPQVELTYEYTHLGDGPQALRNLVTAKSGEFGKILKKASKPLIIVGSAVNEHPDAAAIYDILARLVETHKHIVTDEWNGLATLHRDASRAAAYDLNFVPGSSAAKVTPKFIYMLNADEYAPKDIPKGAFVVYQGHHGDAGAAIADVVLPGMAYTEKGTTWVNTEGRSQMARAAVSGPGDSREDWKILRALSEIVGCSLPYNDAASLRKRMFDLCPSLVRYDVLDQQNSDEARLGLQTLRATSKSVKLSGTPFRYPIDDFYLTNPIARSSATMSKCSKAFVHGIPQLDEIMVMEAGTVDEQGAPEIPITPSQTSLHL